MTRVRADGLSPLPLVLRMGRYVVVILPPLAVNQVEARVLAGGTIEGQEF